MGTAETTNDVRPYRTTRSLARTSAQIQKALELRHTPSDTEQAAWCLLRGSNGIAQEAPELFVQKILDAVWSLPEALG